MKTNSKLLNEVIADAKAVRETAVQTAISRLKETFEPTVRSLISQKLSEEEEEDDDLMDLEMEPEAPAADVAPDVDPTPEPAAAPAPEPEEDFDDELEEILRELEGMEDEDLEEEVDGDGDGERAYRAAGTDGHRVGHTLDEMDEDDMLDEMEDDMLDEMDEYDLDEIIAEMEMELEEEEDEKMEYKESRRRRNRNSISETRELKRKLRKAESELKEAYKAITTQKNVINEVNLLNSKLLFLTKVTSKYNLSAEKQVKVLEAFDRANTVREVKLVYSTICESFNRSVAKKSVNEVASRPTRAVTKGKLDESFTFTSRWQELAGIKK